MGVASKKIALLGIFGALAVLTLYLESIVPTGRLGFFVLSSLFTAAIVMEAGVKSAWTFYVGVSILSFFIVPDKLTVIPYVAFFGIYGILKYYIEKMNQRAIEYILKYAYFNICLFAGLWFAKELFLGDITINFPIYVPIIIMEVAFFAYDYIFTKMIGYYGYRIKKLIK